MILTLLSNQTEMLIYQTIDNHSDGNENPLPPPLPVFFADINLKYTYKN